MPDVLSRSTQGPLRERVSDFGQQYPFAAADQHKQRGRSNRRRTFRSVFAENVTIGLIQNKLIASDFKRLPGVALAARDRIRDHEFGIAIHFSGINVGHAEFDATA
jgi:hypothetical protein